MRPVSSKAVITCICPRINLIYKRLSEVLYWEKGNRPDGDLFTPYATWEHLAWKNRTKFLPLGEWCRYFMNANLGETTLSKMVSLSLSNSLSLSLSLSYFYLLTGVLTERRDMFFFSLLTGVLTERRDLFFDKTAGDLRSGGGGIYMEPLLTFIR